MELNEQTLKDAFRGFKIEDYSNEECLEYKVNLDNDISNLFAKGILPMFAAFEIECNSINIKVHFVNKNIFVYNNFLNSILKNHTCNFNIEKCQTLAKECYAGITDDYIQGNYNDYAVSIGTDILVNQCIYESKFGLHLIVHEIMHSLANKNAVNVLREKENDNGDEAINEFFARIATLIYRNNGGLHAGLTTFNEISGASCYNEELGVYGDLLLKEPCLNNEKYADLNHVKKLAEFYFCGSDTNYIKTYRK